MFNLWPWYLVFTPHVICIMFFTLYICDVCFFIGVYKSEAMWTYRNASLYECFLWTGKLFLIAASLTHTFFMCACRPWTTQIGARSDFDKVAFSHKSVVCKVMIDDSRFFDEVAGVWMESLYDWDLLDFRPVCVMLGKSPATKPLPQCSSHHASQTETKMHNILTHKHTNTKLDSHSF